MLFNKYLTFFLTTAATLAFASPTELSEETGIDGSGLDTNPFELSAKHDPGCYITSKKGKDCHIHNCNHTCVRAKRPGKCRIGKRGTMVGCGVGYNPITSCCLNAHNLQDCRCAGPRGWSDVGWKIVTGYSIKSIYSNCLTAMTLSTHFVNASCYFNHKWISYSISSGYIDS